MSTPAASVYYLTAPRTLMAREEGIDTSLLPPDAVAARTQVSVISPGTEVAAFVGDSPLRPGKTYPRLVGYCNVAEVIAVGTAVEDIHPGDRIATGQSHRSAFVCPRSKVLARLAPGVDPVAAATTYFFCLGRHALLRSGARSGTRVAVLGLGAVGLSAVAVARNAGCRVAAISDQPSLREKALRFGADIAIEKGDRSLSETFAGSAADAQADIIVTTSNRWPDWQIALNIAREGGTIAVLGFPGRTTGPPSFNPLTSRYLYDSQLTIIGCGKMIEEPVGPDDVPLSLHHIYAQMLGLIVEGRLPGADLVSGTVPWQDLESAYRRLSNREPGLVTLALDWR